MGNNTNINDIVARYFFKNCAVSIDYDGELHISHSLKPTPGDIQLNRDFTPARTPSEFIGPQSDFYSFLSGTSESNTSMIKKLLVIGYILCNKLYRHPAMHRSYAFICVNEDKFAYCNGKSLFADAISLFCDYEKLGPGNFDDPFALDTVTKSTQLLIIDGLSAKSNLQPLLRLATSDWVINRRCKHPLIIESERTPHMLLTSQAAVCELRNDLSFRHRFVTLEFSSYWSQFSRIDEHFGHRFFDDWDAEQWQMFDNLMFYCVSEYIHCFSNNMDVFGYYK